MVVRKNSFSAILSRVNTWTGQQTFNDIDQASIDGQLNVDTIAEFTTSNGVDIDGLIVKDGAIGGQSHEVAINDTGLALGDVPSTSTEHFYQGESTLDLATSQNTEGSPTSPLLDYSTLSVLEKLLLNSMLCTITANQQDLTKLLATNDEVWTAKHYYSIDGGTTWNLFATETGIPTSGQNFVVASQSVQIDAEGITDDVKYQLSLTLTAGTADTNGITGEIDSKLSMQVGNIG